MWMRQTTQFRLKIAKITTKNNIFIQIDAILWSLAYLQLANGGNYCPLMCSLLLIFLLRLKSGENSNQPLTWNSKDFYCAILLAFVVRRPPNRSYMFALLLHFFVDHMKYRCRCHPWTQFECHNLFSIILIFALALWFCTCGNKHTGSNAVNVCTQYIYCLWLVNVLFTFIFILFMSWINVFARLNDFIWFKLAAWDCSKWWIVLLACPSIHLRCSE